MSMPQEEFSDSPAPRATRFQFSVRSLLMWMAVVAVALSVNMHRVNVRAYDWAVFCAAGTAMLYAAKVHQRGGDTRAEFLLRTIGLSLVAVGILQAL